MTVKIVRQPAKRLALDKLEQEVQYRKWFPSGLVFTPTGMSQEQIELVIEAFTAFCAANIYIKVPGQRIPFILRDAQKQTIRDLVENRNCIILKARQVGFSTLLAAFALWCVIGGHDRQIYFLSKGKREAIALLNKARYAWRMLPDWLKERPSTPRLSDRTQERMTFDNESFIVSAPSASDPIRGETAWMAIVDEWASIPDQEGAWAAIEPTADVGGRIIGLSTAKGEGNFFHRQWLRAESGNSSFKPIFHSWKAVPERDQAWYDTKVAENEPWFVSQEYPSNPEEAFLGSGNPFFNLELLKTIQPVEPISTGWVQYVDKEGIYVEGSGEVLIWEHPNPKRAYVVGADVAMGLEHGDWSVAYVMEAKSQKIVAMYRGKCHPKLYGNQILPGLGGYYGDALICCEVNNHGLTTLTALQDVRYQNIYRRRSQTQRRVKTLETVGFQTSVSNKPRLMDNLADWLREGGLPLDPDTLRELKTFVRDQNGQHVSLHGSPHDDCVMALGFTVEASRYALENNLAEPKLDDKGSIRWWEKQLSSRTETAHISPVW